MAKNQKSNKSKDSVQDPMGEGLDMNNPYDRDEYSSLVAINTLRNSRLKKEQRQSPKDSKKAK